MSIFAVEKALFDIASSPDAIAAYRAGPEAFLERYSLDADERRQVLELDVYALTAKSINPMLMSRVFAAIRGREHMGEYRQKMRGD